MAEVFDVKENIEKSSYWIKFGIKIKALNRFKSASRQADVPTDGVGRRNSASGISSQIDQSPASSSASFPAIGALVHYVTLNPTILSLGCETNIIADTSSLVSEDLKRALPHFFSSRPTNDLQEWGTRLREQIITDVDAAIRECLDKLLPDLLTRKSADHCVDCKVSGKMENDGVKQIFKIKIYTKNIIKCKKLVVKKAKAVALDHSQLHYNVGR